MISILLQGVPTSSHAKSSLRLSLYMNDQKFTVDIDSLCPADEMRALAEPYLVMIGGMTSISVSRDKTMHNMNGSNPVTIQKRNSSPWKKYRSGVDTASDTTGITSSLLSRLWHHYKRMYVRRVAIASPDPIS